MAEIINIQISPTLGNLSSIVNQIQSRLSNVHASVNISVGRGGLTSIGQINSQIDSAKQNLKKMSDQAIATGGDLEKFGEQSALAIKRFAAFTVATSGFIALASAISSSVKDAIKFEREMFRIAQVIKGSVSGLAGLREEVERLATGLGVSSEKLLVSARTLSQAGLSAEDTRVSLEALAKSELAPTFDNIVDTTEAAIAIFSQFGAEAKELEGILGSINAVSGQFAVESEDIAATVRRTGGAFAAAGGSLNEFIALFTSVRATTRESAETIATGFRTIFTRLQRTRTQNFLGNLGIELRDIEGQFVGPYEAIKRLNAALSEISGTDPRFNQIVEELGGFRQVSKVIPLIQQFGIAQKALAVAQRGQNSLSEDAIAVQDSLAIKITKVKEEFATLIRTISGNDAFKGFIDLSLKLASSLIKLTEALVPIIPALGALGSIAIGRASAGFATGFASKIRPSKFAKGGLVPGSGNTDTFPAYLTPGEFVVKKSAVESIGVSNLSKMNKGGLVPVQKFATSGKVLQVSSKKIGSTANVFGSPEEAKDVNVGDFGAVFLNPIGEQKTYSFSFLRDAVGTKKDNTLSANTKLKDKHIKFNLRVGSLSKETAKFLNSKVNTDIKATVSSIAKNINPDSSFNLSSLSLEQFNLKGITGSVFEAAIAVAGDLFEPRRKSTETFDFPRGLGNIAPKFNSALANIPTDAKLTDTPEARGSIVNKVRNFLSNIEKRSIARQGNKTTSSIISNKGINEEIASTVAVSAFNLPANLAGKPKQLLAFFNSPENSDLGVRAFVKGKDAVGLPHLDQFGKEVTKFKLVKVGQFIQRATGGPIDVAPTKGNKVPTLLTPGEFVFDKATASRLGDRKLDLLNRGIVPGVGNTDSVQADLEQGSFVVNKQARQKLARGGYVGVQRFIGGGSPQSQGGGFGGIAILALAGQLGNTFTESGSEVNKFTNTVVGAVAQLGVLSIATKGLVDSFREAEIAAVAAAEKNRDEAKQVVEQSKKTLEDNLDRKTTFGEKVASASVDKKAAASDVLSAQANLNRAKVSGLSGQINTAQLETELNVAQANLDKITSEQKKLTRSYDEIATATEAARLATNGATEKLEQAKKNLENIKTPVSKGFVGTIKDKFRGQKTFAASAVGGAVGGLLTNSANTSIAAGESASKTAAAGGALSGAAQGAIAGAAFGPWGAAIGAATVGIYGLVTAFQEAEKKFKFDGAIKRLNEFDQTLKSITSGRANPQAQSGIVTRQLSQLQTDLLTSSGDERKDIESRMLSSVPNLEVFLGKLAESSKSFDDFNKSARRILPTFSKFANIPLDDLEKAYREQINLQNKANDVNQLVINEQLNFARRLQNINTILGGIATAQASTVRSPESAAVSELGGIVTGSATTTQQIDFSQIFASPEKIFDDRLFADALNQVAAPFKGVGGSLAQEAIQTQRVQQELPSILQSVRNKAPLTADGETSFAADVREEIKRIIPSASSDILESVSSAISSIIGPEARDEKIIDEINKDLIGTAKKISESLSPIIEVFKEAAPAISDQINKFASGLEKARQGESQIRDKQLKSIDIQEQLIKTRAEFSQAPVRTSDRTNLDKQRLSTILGPQRTLGNSVTDISKSLQVSQQRIVELNSKLQRTSTVDSRGLVQEIEKEKSAIERLNKALDFLSDTAARNAALQDELGNEQKKRELAQGFAETLTFGSAENQRGLSHSLDAVFKLAKTGDIGSIAGSQKDGALQLLKQIGPAVFPGLGKSGNDIIKEVLTRDLQKFGFPPEIIDAILTAGEKEKNLQAQIVANLNTAANAIEAQTKAQESAIGNLVENLKAGFDSFFTRFDDTAKRAEVGAINNKIAQKEVERTTFVEVRDKLEAAKSLGVDGLDGKPKEVQARIQQVQGQAGDVEVVKKIDKELAIVDEITQLLKLEPNAPGNDKSDLAVRLNLLGKANGQLFEDPEGRAGDINTRFKGPEEFQKFLEKLQPTLTEIVGQKNADPIIDIISKERGTKTRATDIADVVAILERELGDRITPEIVGKLNRESNLAKANISQTLQIDIGDVSKFVRNFDAIKKELSDITLSVIPSTVDSIDELSSSISKLKVQAFELNESLNPSTKKTTLSNKKTILGNEVFDRTDPRPRFLFNKGGRVGFNAGGTPNKDSVPAMLTPGELVVPTNVVNSNKPEKLLGFAQKHGFAKGGLVQPPSDVVFTQEEKKLVSTKASEIRRKDSKVTSSVENRVNSLYNARVKVLRETSKELRKSLNSKVDSVDENTHNAYRTHIDTISDQLANPESLKADIRKSIQKGESEQQAKASVVETPQQARVKKTLEDSQHLITKSITDRETKVKETLEKKSATKTTTAPPKLNIREQLADEKVRKSFGNVDSLKAADRHSKSVTVDGQEIPKGRLTQLAEMFRRNDSKLTDNQAYAKAYDFYQRQQTAQQRLGKPAFQTEVVPQQLAPDGEKTESRVNSPAQAKAAENRRAKEAKFAATRVKVQDFLDKQKEKGQQTSAQTQAPQPTVPATAPVPPGQGQFNIAPERLFRKLDVQPQVSVPDRIPSVDSIPIPGKTKLQVEEEQTLARLAKEGEARAAKQRAVAEEFDRTHKTNVQEFVPEPVNLLEQAAQIERDRLADKAEVDKFLGSSPDSLLDDPKTKKVLGLNKGGRVGYENGGIAGVDSVPAMLTPGELVVPNSVMKSGEPTKLLGFAQKYGFAPTFSPAHFAEGGIATGAARKKREEEERQALLALDELFPDKSLRTPTPSVPVGPLSPTTVPTPPTIPTAETQPTQASKLYEFDSATGKYRPRGVAPESVQTPPIQLQAGQSTRPGFFNYVDPTVSVAGVGPFSPILRPSLETGKSSQEKAFPRNFDEKGPPTTYNPRRLTMPGGVPPKFVEDSSTTSQAFFSVPDNTAQAPALSPPKRPSTSSLVPKSPSTSSLAPKSPSTSSLAPKSSSTSSLALKPSSTSSLALKPSSTSSLAPKQEQRSTGSNELNENERAQVERAKARILNSDRTIGLFEAEQSATREVMANRGKVAADRENRIGNLSKSLGDTALANKKESVRINQALSGDIPAPPLPTGNGEFVENPDVDFRDLQRRNLGISRLQRLFAALSTIGIVAPTYITQGLQNRQAEIKGELLGGIPVQTQETKLSLEEVALIGTQSMKTVDQTERMFGYASSIPSVADSRQVAGFALSKELAVEALEQKGIFQPKPSQETTTTAPARKVLAESQAVIDKSKADREAKVASVLAPQRETGVNTGEVTSARTVFERGSKLNADQADAGQRLKATGLSIGSIEAAAGAGQSVNISGQTVDAGKLRSLAERIQANEGKNKEEAFASATNLLTRPGQLKEERGREGADAQAASLLPAQTAAFNSQAREDFRKREGSGKQKLAEFLARRNAKTAQKTTQSQTATGQAFLSVPAEKFTRQAPVLNTLVKAPAAKFVKTTPAIVKKNIVDDSWKLDNVGSVEPVVFSQAGREALNTQFNNELVNGSLNHVDGRLPNIQPSKPNLLAMAKTSFNEQRKPVVQPQVTAPNTPSQEAEAKKKLPFGGAEVTAAQEQNFVDLRAKGFTPAEAKNALGLKTNELGSLVSRERGKGNKLPSQTPKAPVDAQLAVTLAGDPDKAIIESEQETAKETLTRLQDSGATIPKSAAQRLLGKEAASVISNTNNKNRLQTAADSILLRKARLFNIDDEAISNTTRLLSKPDTSQKPATDVLAPSFQLEKADKFLSDRGLTREKFSKLPKSTQSNLARMLRASQMNESQDTPDALKSSEFGGERVAQDIVEESRKEAKRLISRADKRTSSESLVRAGKTKEAQAFATENGLTPERIPGTKTPFSKDVQKKIGARKTGPTSFGPEGSALAERNKKLFARRRRFEEGGIVPALVTPGEAIFSPSAVKSVGMNTLNLANSGKTNGLSSILDRAKIVPGSGNSDTVPINLPVGSFVINKSDTNSLVQREKFKRGGSVGRQRFMDGGGPTQPSRDTAKTTVEISNIGALQEVFATFSKTAGDLATNIGKLSELKIPSSIEFTGNMNLNVVFNGAETLARLQEPMRNLAIKYAIAAVNKHIDVNFDGTLTKLDSLEI